MSHGKRMQKCKVQVTPCGIKSAQTLAGWSGRGTWYHATDVLHTVVLVLMLMLMQFLAT